jgi:1-acyl-sn-glycerol-3-phosphate acyltransferase
MGGFCWYARRLVKKNFFVFAVDDRDLRVDSIGRERSLIVYANHPGWWDPIVGMLLCREYFPERSFFAPIDSEALKKYPSFRKLGYFGIESQTSKGAADFLKWSGLVLSRPGSSLWVTPEGTFTDPRHQSPDFMPGIAHLAAKTSNHVCLPLAIEYPFIEEQMPFMLCRLGKPIVCDEFDGASKTEWSERLQTGLRDTQSALKESVIDRDWTGFRVLIRSKRNSHGSGFPK